jgi:hypothetical protein
VEPTFAKNARKMQLQVVVIHGAEAQEASAPAFCGLTDSKCKPVKKEPDVSGGTCSGRFRSFQCLRTPDKSGLTNCAWYAQTRSSVRLEDVGLARNWHSKSTRK